MPADSQFSGFGFENCGLLNHSTPARRQGFFISFQEDKNRNATFAE
jgi:hypothetical protein